jgi:hypothetical protein
MLHVFIGEILASMTQVSDVAPGPLVIVIILLKVLTIGTLVNFTQYAGLERKTGVVLKHFPDKNQTLVIEIKTRKRHTVHCV